MTRLLRSLGADLGEPAASAAEARERIRERRPDVALVDFNLRDNEPAGELIDWLRDQGIPVILVTGYELVPLQPGKVAAILQKPVSDALLVATVRRVTAR
jgi:CheY-like chemotaxis protein